MVRHLLGVTEEERQARLLEGQAEEALQLRGKKNIVEGVLDVHLTQPHLVALVHLGCSDAAGKGQRGPLCQ